MAFNELLELAKSDTITEENKKNLHKIFYAKIDSDNAGNYRQKPVIVTGADVDFPLPKELDDKIKELIGRAGYSLTCSDKRDINGKEFIIYKIIVNGSSKYFYLTQVKNSYVAMGMIEMTGNASIEESLQSITKIIFSVKM